MASGHQCHSDAGGFNLLLPEETITCPAKDLPEVAIALPRLTESNPTLERSVRPAMLGGDKFSWEVGCHGSCN